MEKEEEREDEQDMKVRKKGVGSRELKDERGRKSQMRLKGEKTTDAEVEKEMEVTFLINHGVMTQVGNTGAEERNRELIGWKPRRKDCSISI